MEKAINNDEAIVVDDLSPSTSAEDAMEKGAVVMISSTDTKVNQQGSVHEDAQDIGGLIKQSKE